MHRLRMTALVGVLALSTSGSDSSKTTFVPDLTAFFPKKPALPTNQKPKSPTGLIETTNIQQRLKQLQQQQGRSDPFTTLFPTPFVETATKPKKAFPDLPKLPLKKELPAPTVKVAPPNTDLAKGVAVEGVLQIGDKTHAIIKLPTDGTSRYVSEGQKLSSGQLLVKRIEISPDSEPLVILSQNGVEISKAVGEQTDKSTDTIASSTLSQIGSDYKTRNDQSSDEVYSNEQAAQSAKATHQQEHRSPKPANLTQPTEKYTAAIPVPSPPPSSSSSQSSSQQHQVIASSFPANSTAPTDTASVGEDSDNSERVSLNSQSSSLRERTSDGLGQNSVANRHYRSSFDLSEKQQQLIDKLRSSSKPEIENKLESDSPSALQTDLEEQTYQQQPMSDGFGYKKPLAGNKLSTTSPRIEVLAHRQRLINELRGRTLPTNP